MLILVFVLGAVALVRLRGPGADTIHDRATLPERFYICGRGFHGPGPVMTLAQIRALGGPEPVVVDIAPLAPCPGAPGAVVYVKVAPDGYAEYTVLGGP